MTDTIKPSNNHSDTVSDVILQNSAVRLFTHPSNQLVVPLHEKVVGGICVRPLLLLVILFVVGHNDPSELSVLVLDLKINRELNTSVAR